MTKKYRQLRDRVKSALSYWIGLAEMEFVGDLHRLMEEEDGGVSRSELARRLGSSPAYVTKALGGNANFTLKTMVKFARSMNAVLHIRLAREGEIVSISQPQTTQDVNTVVMAPASFSDIDVIVDQSPIGPDRQTESDWGFPGLVLRQGFDSTSQRPVVQ